MALKKSFVSPAKFTAPEAYHRILSFRAGPSGSKALVVVATYYDGAARAAKGEPLAVTEQWVDLDLNYTGGNIYTFLYGQLKLLPAFAAAEDV